MSFTASSSLRRLVTVLIVAVVLVAGCSPEAPPSDRVVGAITVITGPAGVNLNPYTNVLSSRQIGVLLFKGLLAVDDAGMPTPDLATEVPTRENGGISQDGTAITYRLDPDARWADGEALTARDVAFTWNLIASGVLTDDPRGTDNVSSVAVVDDHTLSLTLAAPDAPFAWRFCPYVLPEHLLADSPDILSDDFWIRPVGSRGRSVQTHIKGTQVELVDSAGAKPTIRVVFAETDAAARSVWDSQEQCVWLLPPVGPAGAERSDTVPSSRWQAFVMNPSTGHSTADLAVRQAFAQVATYTVTPGTPGPWGLPLGDPSAGDSDVDSALTKAGWRMQDDGRRLRAGEELVVDVLFNPISAEEGDRIEYDMELERFGGRIEPHATFQYTDYAGASRLALGDFDVALLEFPIGIPYGWAWPFDSADVPSESNPAGLNVGRISDIRLDASAEAMRRAGNPAELQEALVSAWSRLEEEYLVLWDVQREQTVLFKGVQGVEAEPFEEYALRSADAWSMIGTDTGE